LVTQYAKTDICDMTFPAGQRSSPRESLERLPANAGDEAEVSVASSRQSTCETWWQGRRKKHQYPSRRLGRC
jgi:hypothetical protein